MFSGDNTIFEPKEKRKSDKQFAVWKYIVSEKVRAT